MAWVVSEQVAGMLGSKQQATVQAVGLVVKLVAVRAVELAEELAVELAVELAAIAQVTEPAVAVQATAGLVAALFEAKWAATVK